MMTITGKLLGALVLIGLLGGCSTAPLLRSEDAKDPKISTNAGTTAPKATIFGSDSMK